MEDQPADAGDLTKDSAAPAPAPRRVGRHRWFRPRPTVTPAAETTTEASDQPDAEASDQPDAEASDQPDAEASDQPDAAEPAADEKPAPPTPKPVTRLLVAAVAAAVVLFVAAGAFAGAMLQPYLVDKATVNAKLDIARTAASAITTLWTYTPENMDTLADRSAKYLSGDFADQYRKYIDAIAPVNKQAKVTNNTQVVGAAVESLQGKDATAVVYTNTTNSTPQSNNIPSLKYLSYRLTMQRNDSRWVITKMTTITSVNLTPQLG